MVEFCYHTIFYQKRNYRHEQAYGNQRFLPKLGQLLSLIERPQFERCVKATHANKYCKGFSAWQQFVTMTYAQIVNPHGLRSLEHSLNSNPTCLYHLGISKEVKRSTISYANNTRNPEVLWENRDGDELITLGSSYKKYRVHNWKDYQREKSRPRSLDYDMSR